MAGTHSVPGFAPSAGPCEVGNAPAHGEEPEAQGVQWPSDKVASQGWNLGLGGPRATGLTTALFAATGPSPRH